MDLLQKAVKREPPVIRERIGQGTFGCAYIPSWPCEPGENTDLKITKASIKEDFELEKKNYDKINSIDPEYIYHLPYTSHCQVTKEAKRIINSRDSKINCILQKNSSQPSDMLNMWNGGLSLHDFIENLHKFEEKDKYKYILDFWYCSHHLILFLAELKFGGLHHNDLKPHNVVFDYLHRLELSQKNRVKVIDFGHVYEKPICGRNFVYPPESLAYRSLENYNYLCDYQNFRSIFNKFLYTKGSHMDTFLKYTTSPYTFFNQSYINLFSNGKSFYEEGRYEEMMNQVEETIDIYGMGLVFTYMLKSTGRHMASIDKKYDIEFVIKMSEICFDMVNPNCFERTNLLKLLFKYINIFEELYPIFEDYGIKKEEFNDIYAKFRIAMSKLNQHSTMTSEPTTSSLDTSISDIIVDKYETLHSYDSLLGIIKYNVDKHEETGEPITFRRLFHDNFNEDDIAYLDGLLQTIRSDRYSDKDKYQHLVVFLTSLMEIEDKVIETDELNAVKHELEKLKEKEEKIIEREVKLTTDLDNLKRLHRILVKIKKAELVEKLQENPDENSINFHELAMRFFEQPTKRSNESSERSTKMNRFKELIKTNRKTKKAFMDKNAKPLTQYIDELESYFKSKLEDSELQKHELKYLMYILSGTRKMSREDIVNIYYDLDYVIKEVNLIVSREQKEAAKEKEIYKKMTLVGINAGVGTVHASEYLKQFNPTTEDMKVIIVHASLLGPQKIYNKGKVNALIGKVKREFFKNKQQKDVKPIDNIFKIAHILDEQSDTPPKKTVFERASTVVRTGFRRMASRASQVVRGKPKNTPFNPADGIGPQTTQDGRYNIQIIGRGNEYFEKTMGDDTESPEINILSEKIHDTDISGRIKKNPPILLTDIINFFDRKGVKYLVLFDFSNVNTHVRRSEIDEAGAGILKLGKHDEIEKARELHPLSYSSVSNALPVIERETGGWRSNARKSRSLTRTTPCKKNSSRRC
jgi:hypothetical protein